MNEQPGSSEEQVRREQATTAFDNAVETYNSFYGDGKQVGLHIVKPGSVEADRLFSDGIVSTIPRCKYLIEAGYNISPDKKKVTGIALFQNPEVTYLNGDIGMVDNENPEEALREILGHEFIHSQTKPTKLIGVDSPPLLARDIRYGGDLHYVIGFKTVNFNMDKKIKTEPTRLLDEFVVQYLTMCMFGDFQRQNTTLEKMKVHGLGINKEYILGAELLHALFERLGITPQQVEKFHKDSDIKGFLNFVRSKNEDVAKIILKSGLAKDNSSGLEVLKSLELLTF